MYIHAWDNVGVPLKYSRMLIEWAHGLCTYWNHFKNAFKVKVQLIDSNDLLELRCCHSSVITIFWLWERMEWYAQCWGSIPFLLWSHTQWIVFIVVDLLKGLGLVGSYSKQWLCNQSKKMEEKFGFRVHFFPSHFSLGQPVSQAPPPPPPHPSVVPSTSSVDNRTERRVSFY